MTAPTIETIRQAVIECVQKVAPEADFATVAPAKSSFAGFDEVVNYSFVSARI